jgi:hypothetical protein
MIYYNQNLKNLPLEKIKLEIQSQEALKSMYKVYKMYYIKFN